MTEQVELVGGGSLDGSVYDNIERQHNVIAKDRTGDWPVIQCRFDDLLPATRWDRYRRDPTNPRRFVYVQPGRPAQEKP